MGSVAGAALGAVSSLGGSGGGGTEQTQESSSYEYSKPSTYAPTSQGYLDAIPIYKAYAEQAMDQYTSADDKTQLATRPVIQGSYAAFDNLLDSLGVSRPKEGSWAAANADFGSSLKQTSGQTVMTELERELGTKYGLYKDPTTGRFSDVPSDFSPKNQSSSFKEWYFGAGGPGAGMDQKQKDYLMAKDQWTYTGDAGPKNATSPLAGQQDASASEPYMGSRLLNYLSHGATLVPGENMGGVEHTPSGDLGRGLINVGDGQVGPKLTGADAQRTINAYNGLQSGLTGAAFDAALSDLIHSQGLEKGDPGQAPYNDSIRTIQDLQKFAAQNGTTVDALLRSSGEMTDKDQAQARIKSLLESDPNYQFQLNQGNKSIQAMAAAKGMGNDPRLAAELQSFGQGQASSAMQSYQDRMMAITNSGLNQIQLAAQSRANAAQGNAEAAGSLGNAIGSNQTNSTNTWQVGPITSEKWSNSSSSSSGGGNSGLQTAGNVAKAAGGFLKGIL